MAWLIILFAILAIAIFLVAMYFNFKEFVVEDKVQKAQSQEKAINLDRLSTMVAEKIMLELLQKTTPNLETDDFLYNLSHGSIADEKESNIIDFF